MMLHEPEISDYVKLAACVVAVAVVQTVWPYIFPPGKERYPPRPRFISREIAGDDAPHRHDEQGGLDDDDGGSRGH